MPIDPRLVSTPVGAALGVLVARKLLDKKDHTLKNMIIGGGLGGGAGYLAGQFIKGEPGNIESPEGYMRYIKRQVPTGAPSKQEVEAVDKLLPGGIYGGLPARGGGPVTRFKRRQLSRNAGEREAAKVYKFRSLAFRQWAANPNISDNTRQALLNAAEQNQRSFEEMDFDKSMSRATSPLENMSDFIMSLVSKK